MKPLSELSWPEVHEALNSGRRTVVFAAGSTEQHGMHLPLATDTLIGDALADRVAQQVPDTLRGPTLPLGVSTHHMAFPGTLTIEDTTFKSVIHDYVQSLGAHGFDNVLVLPSHGGNFAPLRELRDETEGHIGGARFIPYTDLLQFVNVMSQVGGEDGFSPEVTGAHAGEAETSIILSLHQELVAMENAVAGYDKPFDEKVTALLFQGSEGTKALSAHGVLGDPRPATAERGRRYLDALTDLLSTYFRTQLGPRH